MAIKTVCLTLSLLATPLLFQTAHAEAAVQLQKQNSSQSVTLDMQNMTRAMRKYTIKKALQGVEGVQKVSVDADAKTADVTFDPQKTSIEALIKATTNAGYPATARDGGRDSSRQSSAFPPSMEVRSVAIDTTAWMQEVEQRREQLPREPMRPTVHKK